MPPCRSRPQDQGAMNVGTASLKEALMSVAEKAEGFSGRALRKLPFQAHAFFVQVCCMRAQLPPASSYTSCADWLHCVLRLAFCRSRKVRCHRWSARPHYSQYLSTNRGAGRSSPHNSSSRAPAASRGGSRAGAGAGRTRAPGRVGQRAQVPGTRCALRDPSTHTTS